MAELILSNGMVALIDDDLVAYLSRWNWCYDGRYAMRMAAVDRQKYKIYLHSVINQTPPVFDTDHINGNKLDNRGINLRSITRGFNNFNKPKQLGDYSSKYKGVIWDKQKRKWRSNIKTNGKVKHLGFFVNEEDAAKAYDVALREKIKEVRTNF